MPRPLRTGVKPQGSPRQKPSGWILPAAFCCALVAAAVICWFIRQPSGPQAPAIDAELSEIASAWTGSLTDEEGNSFRKEMADAATGLTSLAARDSRIAELGRKALDAGRLDAACTAVLFLKSSEFRLSLLRSIEKKALTDCATLPWGAFAVRSMAGDDPDAASVLSRELNAKWESCGRSLGPDYQEDGPIPGTGTDTDSDTDPDAAKQDADDIDTAKKPSGQPAASQGNVHDVIPAGSPIPADQKQDKEGREADSHDDDDEPARVVPAPDGKTELGAQDDDQKPDNDAAPEEHDIKN